MHLLWAEGGPGTGTPHPCSHQAKPFSQRSKPACKCVHCARCGRVGSANRARCSDLVLQSAGPHHSTRNQQPARLSPLPTTLRAVFTSMQLMPANPLRPLSPSTLSRNSDGAARATSRARSSSCTASTPASATSLPPTASPGPATPRSGLASFRLTISSCHLIYYYILTDNHPCSPFLQHEPGRPRHAPLPGTTDMVHGVVSKKDDGGVAGSSFGCRASLPSSHDLVLPHPPTPRPAPQQSLLDGRARHSLRFTRHRSAA